MIDKSKLYPSSNIALFDIQRKKISPKGMIKVSPVIFAELVKERYKAQILVVAIYIEKS